MIQTKSITDRMNWKDINATRILVSTLGVILGISGICHGFFEVLQGNTPTNGMMVYAIGEADRMWAYGNEPAFTIIPNFLATGTAAIIISLAAIIWSVGYIHKKNGPLVFLLLFVLSFLVGAGIGQSIFFTIGWIIATRINKPHNWWRNILGIHTRRTLAKLWILCLTLFSLFLLFALEIAVFGFVPGINAPEFITIVMLSSLGTSLVFLILTSVCGFAHDINRYDFRISNI